MLYHSNLLSGGVQKGGVEEDGFANYYGPGRDRKQTNHPAVSIPLSIYHTFVSMANRVEWFLKKEKNWALAKLCQLSVGPQFQKIITFFKSPTFGAQGLEKFACNPKIS